MKEPARPKAEPYLTFVIVNEQKHFLVETDGNKLRACMFCAHRKVKTLKGWGVYTRYQCSRCNIALCTGKRNCFQMYHEWLRSSKLGPKMLLNVGPSIGAAPP